MADTPVQRGRAYLDHAATSPPRRSLAGQGAASFGNPSSLHLEGREARLVLEDARRSILASLRADGFRLVFTSGGTESDALAVLGAWLAARDGAPGRRGRGARVLASAVEHPAVLGAVDLVRELGGRGDLVPVDREGRLRLDALESALQDGASLLSLMAANNETGVLEPISEAARLAASAGTLVHVDAVQALGRVPLDIAGLPVAFWSFSAHKLGGPRGIGALLVREGAPLRPWMRGGPQEQGLRAGTEAALLAAEFAGAVAAAVGEMERSAVALGRLRDRLRGEIEARYPGAVVHTPRSGSLPTHLSVSFPWVEGESLVRHLDLRGAAVSTGSACQSGSGKPSHVLEAMGLGPREIRGSIRVSLGWSSEPEDVDRFLEALDDSLEALCAVSPFGPFEGP